MQLIYSPVTTAEYRAVQTSEILPFNPTRTEA
jgi:hypothetical protein